MFEIGDVIVYPVQGLSEVQAIETRRIGESSMEFYVLKILKKNISVMVPVTNEERIGLRAVCGQDEIVQVQQILGQQAGNRYTQWHHRYSDNYEKLKTGSILRMAEVLRDLSALKLRKNLAIKESRMMENAMCMLVGEIAHVLAISEESVTQWVEALLQGDGSALLPLDDEVLGLEASA